MAASSKAVTPIVFTKEQMIQSLALCAWMSYSNQDANLRYPAASTIKDTYTNVYAEPDTGYLTSAEWNKQVTPATTGTPSTVKAPAANAPSIHAAYQMMILINALLEGDDIGSVPALADFTNVYNRTDDIARMLLLLTPTANPTADKENRRKLGLHMLETLTRFRERGFMTMEEEINSAKPPSEDDKTRYLMFSALHARVLNRTASGNALDQVGASTFARVGGIALRGLIVLPLYPLFMVVGAALLIGKSVGFNHLSDVYTSRWNILTSGLNYQLGDAGRKYLAQAGLDTPGKGGWFWDVTFTAFGAPRTITLLSLRGAHKVFGYVSVALTVIPEFLVKTIFWPLKMVIGYDRLATDNPIRQAINGLENTIIGILCSPVILANNLYRTVLDWGNMTFSDPANDPHLKAMDEWFKKNMPGMDFNLSDGSQRDVADYTVIVFYKILRFFFDTAPRIIVNTVTGTLRSILPAMPGTTKEQRDNACNALWYTLYSGLFVINALFLSTMLLSAVGVALPGGLLSIFGAAGAQTPAEIAMAYGHQIWNVVTTVGNGFASVAAQLGNYFVGNLNPVHALVNLFGEAGYIATGFSAIGTALGSKVAIAGTAIGSFFGLGAIAIGVTKGWKKFNKNLQEQDNAAIYPTVFGNKDDTLKKVEAEHSRLTAIGSVNESVLNLGGSRDRIRENLAAQVLTTATAGAVKDANVKPDSNSPVN